MKLSGESVGRLTEHFFRQEAGKLVSVLTRHFGVARLQLAEDVVQEALVRAIKTWPYYGVPENPAAWITQTAKNLALDALRREKNLEAKQAGMASDSNLWSSQLDGFELAESEIEDARLRLMFVCCHPALPLDSQTSLALKSLCGFSVGEIASAFLTNEATIAKRLTRAKEKMRDENVPYDLPTGEDLEPRLQAVHNTLYLLFNEGYKSSSDAELIRRDLCDEAIRLVSLILRNKSCATASGHALLALMLFNRARFDARLDPKGQILQLADQDRSLWDRGSIATGLWHLSQSAQGQELEKFHLQAGIAALHCTAPTFEETDWESIVKLYDLLLQVEPSPVVALNRAVAVGRAQGAAEGLSALQGVSEQLKNYYLLFAVLADFEAELGNHRQAAVHLQKALELCEQQHERDLLQTKLDKCLSTL